MLAIALGLVLGSHSLLSTLRSGIILRPMLGDTSGARRLAVVRLAADPADATSDEAWPKPARSAAEVQDAQTKAKEEAEAAIQQAAAPLTTEGGTFSYVAAFTVIIFFIGGAAFFQGITGGGALKLATGDQPPEVQECIQRATTRSEAGLCLPPVPLL